MEFIIGLYIGQNIGLLSGWNFSAGKKIFLLWSILNPPIKYNFGSIMAILIEL